MDFMISTNVRGPESAPGKGDGFESAEAIDPKNLQAVLEKNRDIWLSETPQESFLKTQDYKDVSDATKKMHNADRESAVRMLKSAIAANNKAGLDAVHSTIRDAINRGIKAVVALAEGSTVPVRATVKGHFKTIKTGGNPVRLIVELDHATDG